jgi:hypothetical protein
MLDENRQLKRKEMRQHPPPYRLTKKTGIECALSQVEIVGFSSLTSKTSHEIKCNSAN